MRIFLPMAMVLFCFAILTGCGNGKSTQMPSQALSIKKESSRDMRHSPALAKDYADQAESKMNHDPGMAQGLPAPAAPAPMMDAPVVAEKAKMDGEKPAEPSPTIKQPEYNTESYSRIYENPFILTSQDPRSTFSIDVDTASYSNVRRFLTQNSLPPKDSVRIEELVNYFTYDYPQPTGDAPFSANMEVSDCPWNPKHRMVRVALKGKEMAVDKRPVSNLVFLLDVSGSMFSHNKLPLLKESLKMLLHKLGENDRVAIAVYAGASGLVLPSTTCDKKEVVIEALERLSAGGSTNAGDGIQLAYKVAVENFIKGGVNRVILATDGDFNVGMTSQGDMIRLIEEKAKTGVFLTVLGFGMDNYKDDMLEQLANKGNGNYAYIDTMLEAKKVLVEQLSGTLVTIAKDVKIQVEFNPAKVKAHRLVGYENRMLRHEDFKDDTKDAGEIGAGHTVTAFYEIVPAGKDVEVPGVDPLKYQKEPALSEAAQSGEMLTLKLRYKKPDADKSVELQYTATDNGTRIQKASQDFVFAASVASFGMILRDSKYKGNVTMDFVLELAQESKGNDPSGYRAEFIELVKKAKQLTGK